MNKQLSRVMESINLHRPQLSHSIHMLITEGYGM